MPSKNGLKSKGENLSCIKYEAMVNCRAFSVIRAWPRYSKLPKRLMLSFGDGMFVVSDKKLMSK